MYKIKNFNATSISINGLLYTKNHNAIQALPGRISIVSINDDDDFLLFNEPVTNVMIEDETYPNEREFILAFETLKKSDASGGATSGDIVNAINALMDIIIEKSDEEIQAIKGLVDTQDFDVDTILEAGASQEFNFAMTVETGHLYDVGVAGVPAGVDYTHTITTGFVKINFVNNGNTQIVFQNTVTITVKKE